jgi:phage gpG-like protein
MIELDWPEPAMGLRNAMRGKRDGLADFGRLHRQAAAVLVGWVKQNFDQRGALLEDQPSGWPGLAPRTLARKRRLGQNDQPLVATGRLRASFAAIANGEKAEVFNPVPYTRFHQQGDGVPRRAVFPQPDQAARIIWPEVIRHVEEALA